MGAIYGIKYFDRHEDQGEFLLKKMGMALQHRGACSKNVNINSNCLLGVRAENDLCVQKKSASDNVTNVHVVMDGDIYKCESRDPVHSQSDAQLVLKLYNQHGLKFVEIIDGNYAICIYEGHRDRLVLVRERVGVKPLYFLKLDHCIVFASEIKAILECREYNRSIDLQCLDRFLTYGYVTTPDTLFKSIYQVIPGYMLVLENGKVSEKKYWEFKYGPIDHESEDSIQEKFLDRLTTAVSRRLSKHPDAGAYLSGGLDSSSVVALMKKIEKKPFSVFTAGFREEKFDEISDAKIVADHLCLDHKTVLVDIEDLPALIAKLVWHFDAPFLDTSAIPSYAAAKITREYVGTVFTGDLPDQLLGGSGHHAFWLNKKQKEFALKSLLRHKAMRRIVYRLICSAGTTSYYDKVKRRIYRETFSLEEQSVILRSHFPELLKRKIYTPSMRYETSQSGSMAMARKIFEEVQNEALINKILYYDVLSYARDDLMPKVERMTMAHGLTAVSPFHDVDLIEYVATLPISMKIREGNRKYVLRKSVESLLPIQTIQKRKQGFAIPIDEWLKGKLSVFVQDVLLDSKTLQRGYFEPIWIKKMVENYFKGKTDYATGGAYAIFALVTLELWHRIFLD